MATIVNNPPPIQVPVQVSDTSGSSVGWAVAIIILILVVVGGIAYAKYHSGGGTTNNTYNASVTVPASGGTAPAPSTGGSAGTAPAPSTGASAGTSY